MRKYCIGLFVSAILIIGLVGNIINLYKVGYATDDNTVELQAIVISEETYGSARRQQHTVYTEEYGEMLKIPSGINESVLQVLPNIAGETIYFRINKVWAEQLTEPDYFFVDVVELKTAQKVLYSMEDYNRAMEKDWGGAFITAIIVIFIMVLLMIRCILKIQHFMRTRKKS